MLYLFGFDTVALAACDLYFHDPEAHQGAEQGVRVELRLVERGHADTIFAAGPITLGRPIWRADLLESVDHPATLDRAHQHRSFDGWEPNDREFDDDLSADPVRWLTGRIADLDRLVAETGIDRSLISTADADAARAAVPAIESAVRWLLDGVRAGRLGQPAVPADSGPARVGWL